MILAPHSMMYPGSETPPPAVFLGRDSQKNRIPLRLPAFSSPFRNKTPRYDVLPVHTELAAHDEPSPNVLSAARTPTKQNRPNNLFIATQKHHRRLRVTLELRFSVAPTFTWEGSIFIVVASVTTAAAAAGTARRQRISQSLLEVVLRVRLSSTPKEAFILSDAKKREPNKRYSRNFVKGRGVVRLPTKNKNIPDIYILVQVYILISVL